MPVSAVYCRITAAGDGPGAMNRSNDPLSAIQCVRTAVLPLSPPLTSTYVSVGLWK